MDIEWAIDGKTKELFIIQARPETIHSRKKDFKLKEYKIKNKKYAKKIISGIASNFSNSIDNQYIN